MRKSLSMLKKNMGQIDRTIRVVLALLFGYLYFTGMVTGAAGVTLLVIAFVFIVTSLISSCPLYSLLGIKTCKAE